MDGVVITGGEPTLQKNLASICEKAKRIGYLVKLDTNGSRPHIIKALIDAGLVDFIAMDIKTSLEEYQPPLCREALGAKVTKSINLILSSGLAYEFRTTCVAPFVDEDRIAHIASAIRGARQYTLQTFHPNALLDPDYYKDRPAALPPETITRLQAVAAPFVEHCNIR